MFPHHKIEWWYIKTILKICIWSLHQAIHITCALQNIRFIRGSTDGMKNNKKKLTKCFVFHGFQPMEWIAFHLLFWLLHIFDRRKFRVDRSRDLGDSMEYVFPQALQRPLHGEAHAYARADAHGRDEWLPLLPRRAGLELCGRADPITGGVHRRGMFCLDERSFGTRCRRAAPARRQL